MKIILYGGLGFLAGVLALQWWSSSPDALPPTEVPTGFIVFCLIALAGYLVWRSQPLPEKVIDAVKAVPFMLVVLFAKDIATWTIQYLPAPFSTERLSVLLALVLVGNLFGVLIPAFAPQFRQDQATNLRSYSDGILRGTYQVNLWPYAIVVLGILFMGIAFWTAAPSDPYSEFGIGVLIFVTLIWSGFLPLVIKAASAILYAKHHRQAPSLQGFLDDLAVQDATNGTKPQIRPQ